MAKKVKPTDELREVDFHGYLIREDGRVLRKNGKPMTLKWNTSRSKYPSGARYEVRLVVDGVRKSYILSRLMYELFVGFDSSDRDLCVVHIDGDKRNIHLNNLALKHRRELIQGENSHMAILSDAEVAEIRKRYKGMASTNQYSKSGPSLQDLANLYGVSKKNIAYIVKNQTRTNYKL